MTRKEFAALPYDTQCQLLGLPQSAWVTYCAQFGRFGRKWADNASSRIQRALSNALDAFLKQHGFEHAETISDALTELWWANTITELLWPNTEVPSLSPVEAASIREHVQNVDTILRVVAGDLPLPPADPRALHERAWVDAVSRENDDEYARRIAHGFPDYYFSTHWQLVSEEFSTGRCAHCGRTDRDTSLHHLNDHSFGRERREDVVELCDSCHAREEGRGLWKYRRAA